MRVNWYLGKENLDYNTTKNWFILGVRDSGKSSYVEHVGEQYLQKGNNILDLFGSRDGEGLAWLRNPMVDHGEILLVHGDNVDVTAPTDTRRVSNLTLKDLAEYRVIISSSPLYSSVDDEFEQVNRITALLYKRLHWKKIIYLIAREAANLYYSRLKVGNNQTQAKADMTYLIREARHMGLSMGLDTLKYTSIDADIRAVTDFLVFKAQGVMPFPRELYWIFRYVDPNKMRRIPKNGFVFLSRRGPLGAGTFPEVKWHKQAREDILTELGISTEYGEEIHYGEDKGSFRTLSDFKHIELIDDYIDGKGGMGKIADAHDVSPGTVHNHIKNHNDMVGKNGECETCRRAEGENYNRKAVRTR